VFKALTSAETTAKFWFGNAATSNWKVGSPIEFRREGKLIVQGKILENDPPQRLSYTFHSMHEPFNGSEKPSRVVFELEQQRDQVKLTVTHDHFAEDSKVFPAISNGWPLVLSSLKSILRRTACFGRRGTTRTTKGTACVVTAYSGRLAE
jgi:uncharacterized protein YndB with AHSA1/START domain